MRVINFFAGPGAGKSTLAATLFAEMKRRGLNVELVTEYAKDMVWENRTNILSDQLYMLAKQNRRLERLRSHVDYVITDSPLLLCCTYAPQGYFSSFHDLVWDAWRSYDNVSFFLDRLDVKHSQVGRSQTRQEAEDLDWHIHCLLIEANEPHHSVPADCPATTLLDHIL